jgi:hypothetical protein
MLKSLQGPNLTWDNLAGGEHAPVAQAISYGEGGARFPCSSEGKLQHGPSLNVAE